MKLVNLTVVNFMPYKGQQTLDFPLDEARNVMIIFGDNMRGKTSLLNALRWGFYGQALGRHSRIIPLIDIVNKDAAAEGDWRVEVFISFENDGANYELRRSANLRNHIAIPSRSDDFLTTTLLTRNGSVMSGDQIEAEIDQIAPEQTSRFFLFDGELLDQYEQLLIEGSEQGRKIKEAIEQVLGVPSLINGRNELGTILKSATKRQSTEMAHVEGLRAQAQQSERLTAMLDSYEEDLKAISKKLDDTKQEKAELEDALEAAATTLALQAQMNASTEMLKLHNDTIQSKKTERHAVLSEAWKDLLIPKINMKRTILEARIKELNTTTLERGRLLGERGNINKILEKGECPTCLQSITGERRAPLGTKLAEIEISLAKFSDSVVEMQDLSAQISALQKIQSIRAKERLESIDKDLKMAEVGAQRAENDIEKIKAQIEGQDTAELARKRALKDEKLREEGRLTEDVKGIKINIQKTKDELAITRKSIEGLAATRASRITKKVALTAELERIFIVSIERLRDRLRDQVETLASSAFKRMTTQKSYRGLEINQNYGLSIIDSAGRKVSLRSAGAEQIVALSLIDGLNRTGRAIGPVVMDTPFGRLDLNHRDNILKYLPTVSSQFVLLVHSGEIRPETDLISIKPKIGAVYTIEEVSDTQSRIQKAAL